jgi:tetratricopeptide (TPR) repeat protein
MKLKHFIFLGMIFCFSVSLFAQDADELIAQGDELYQEMQDMETAQKALSLYRQAANILENKYEAFWRIARMMYYVGEHTESKKEKKNIFAQAVYFAERAVEANPEKPDAYYWRGVNNGKVGETRGVLKSLSLVKPIKQDMNKVIEIDRTYEDGGADRVLGRVYYKLPGFAGGSKDKSQEHLEKSKELGPNDATTRIYLAETYMDQNEIEKARAELEYVLNMPDDPSWMTAVEECKEMARELLQDKKFRK